MYLLDISFLLIYIPWIIGVGLVELKRKRGLREFFSLAVVSVYASIAICRCIFPVPVITNELAREQYAYYEVENYLTPLSFIKQHCKLWLVQLVMSVPFGVLFGLFSQKRKGILAQLLFAVAFAMGGCLLIVLMNKISGLHYLSLSVDSAMASGLGVLLGEALINLIKWQIEKEYMDEQV